MTVARKLMLGMAIGPLFMVAIGLIAWGSTRYLLNGNVLVVHTYQVLASIEKADARLAQAESLEREYLLFGDNERVEPYRRAAEEANRELDHLTQLTSDNPRQQGRLGTLRPLLAQRLSQFDAAI